MYMRKVGIWGEVRTVWRRATTYEQRMHVGASVPPAPRPWCTMERCDTSHAAEE